MATNVLIIGVGSMGSGMALHLVSLPSYNVIGFDDHSPTLHKFTSSYENSVALSNPERSQLIEIQKKITIQQTHSPFPGNKFADIIIFMVVNSAQIEQFLFNVDESGISFASKIPSTTTILIMSTCSPSAVLSINDRLRLINPKHPQLIDAPVSGGPVKARDGKLSIMLSKNPNSEKEPYFQLLKDLSNQGSTLTLFPPLRGQSSAIGAGSMAKTLHQLLAGVHIAAAAEVLALAHKCGIDLDVFYSMVTGGAAGASWMFADRGKRMLNSIHGDDVEVKSRMTIFIKDLGIVLEEAKKVSVDEEKEDATLSVPLAASALHSFQTAVDRGLGDEDDSSLWKIFAPTSATANASTASSVTPSAKRGRVDSHLASNEIVQPKDDGVLAVEVGDEPLHKVKLHNEFTRAILVKFDEGVNTLLHTHSKDSVYLFLARQGSKVRNCILGQPEVEDKMDFGEVRYGYHCRCPLTHKICAEIGGGGVLCVDAEVLAPPPLILSTATNMAAEEVESLPGHELVKVREKVRVFRATLAPGEEKHLDLNFYHLQVVCQASDVRVIDAAGTPHEISSIVHACVGDIQWSGPIRNRIVSNLGDKEYSYFLVQWRNFRDI